MTPPTTAGVLTTPATAGKGNVVVGANGGVHGAVFGPTVANVGGRLRYGLLEDLELVVDGTGFVVAEDSVADEHRGLYALRAGTKFRVVEHFALLGGLGLGYAPAFGVFGGVDLGFVAAFENPYAIPFFAGRVAFGAPINPDGVDTGQAESDDLPGEVVAAPDRTLVASGELGMRVPVGPRLDAQRRRVNLLGAFVLTYLHDGRGGLIEERNGVTAVGMNLGVEVLLR